MKSYLTDWIRDYAPWTALLLLFTAIFIASTANGMFLPLVLLCLAVGLVVFRYWDAIKAFDFWAFDEWVRARKGSIGIREWHTPYRAAEHFCDPNIVKAHNEAAAKINSIMMELIKDTGRKIGTPNTASPLPRSENEGTRPFSSAPGLRQLDYEATKAILGQNNLKLAHDLLRQLIAGDLVAKGLPTQNDRTQSERIIPTSHWRIMSIDISKAEASGHGLHYIGIVVGKKPSR